MLFDYYHLYVYFHVGNYNNILLCISIGIKYAIIDTYLYHVNFVFLFILGI